jgi:hypothetical protein
MKLYQVGIGLLIFGSTSFLGCSHITQKRAIAQDGSSEILIGCDFSDANWIDSFKPFYFDPEGLDKTQLVFDSEHNKNVLEVTYPSEKYDGDSSLNFETNFGRYSQASGGSAQPRRTCYA